MAYMFDIKSGGKAHWIEWLFESNLRSLGDFKYSTAFWLLLDPSCKGNSITRVCWAIFNHRLSPDAQNRAFAKNGSCIQILDTALRGQMLAHLIAWYWQRNFPRECVLKTCRFWLIKPHNFAYVVLLTLFFLWFSRASPLDGSVEDFW